MIVTRSLRINSFLRDLPNYYNIVNSVICDGISSLAVTCIE